MSLILVDTCIWSIAFRKKNSHPNIITETLTEIIKNQKAILIGPIRQEILSGYSDLSQFNKLKEKLAHFPNIYIEDIDYETAAQFFNLCRKNGIQGSHIDFLICAVASRIEAKIFTTDKDFEYYSQHLPIKLFNFSMEH